MTDEPLFDRGGWWDPSCRAFASLRAVTAFRLELLRRWLPGDWSRRTVVDLGCGGGLLAVPLAAAGARVLGVDVARQALQAGQDRGAAGFLPLCADLARTPLATGTADVVLLADVLEHLAAPAPALGEAARLLRPGGRLFVNTIDRSPRARWLAVTLGEGLGLVPRGTHDWRLFVRPEELDAMATAAGLRRVARTGEAPRLWRTLRQRAISLRESPRITAGYAALYERVGA
ncbi:MAG: bifunctional 2-polyprenyl-6-hydroxyphenol methylase/3-demethylubiquinol 3-O-methyltransferase UbiG [Planctomycetes bacterium]|nr:bifunctional 2-polyprenyl-6-hydroxyphenol methylase/3-demethylubiquinol 3-O-methyltransferase UbiG [Planctomycetota bacterium]